MHRLEEDRRYASLFPGPPSWSVPPTHRLHPYPPANAFPRPVLTPCGEETAVGPDGDLKCLGKDWDITRFVVQSKADLKVAPT